MKTFSEKVKEARVSLGISQPQLGKKIGLSVRSVIAYEKGEKKPRPASMLKLAKALGVSVKFLSDDECEDPWRISKRTITSPKLESVTEPQEQRIWMSYCPPIQLCLQAVSFHRSRRTHSLKPS